MGIGKGENKIKVDFFSSLIIIFFVSFYRLINGLKRKGHADDVGLFIMTFCLTQGKRVGG